MTPPSVGSAPFTPPRVLIAAWEPACLLPIFGEAALTRLVRLAASEGCAVTVLLTPELRGALSRRPRDAGIVVWRLTPREELPEAAAQVGGHPQEPVLLLPGHSVWDRRSFRRALAGVPGSLSAFRLAAAQVPVALEEWREKGVPTIEGGLPVLLSRPEDAPAAEARLVAALAAATQESDGFLARWVDRPLSRRLSPRLAAWGVPPNAVTLAGVSIGLAGAFLLALAVYPAQVAGALLFWAAVVLDGVDGEVARLSLKESRFGHYLDIITDNLVHVGVFVGLAVGLYRQAPDARHLYALGLLLIGFGLCALAVYMVLGRQDQAAEGTPAERLITALNSRDFAYLILLLAVANRLHWFLWGAAVGTYVFAGLLFTLGRRADRAGRA
ncbi:MAG: CDP-alcohol phosphatidyltransferase family protein [Desulfobaccales bacterium]